MQPEIQTKFGIAKIGNHGYYKISENSKGYYGKLLHRLIYEDYHNLQIPKNSEIHHIDGNKLNNNINNLIMMSKEEHRRLHFKERKGTITEETKKKISNTLKGNKLSKDTREKIVDVHTDKFINNSKSVIAHTKRKGKSLINMSKHQNTTGYFRVTKLKNKQCVQGFTWAYKYYDENGKQQHITCVNIDKLKEKVLSKGLDWIEYNNEEVINVS